MVSTKSKDETENIQELLKDLNEKIDDKFNIIIQNIKTINKIDDKINYNDIIFL